MYNCHNNNNNKHTNINNNKHTKIKSAIKLYQNKNPTMGLVRVSEERAVDKGNQLLIKEASTFAEEMGISL